MGACTSLVAAAVGACRPPAGARRLPTRGAPEKTDTGGVVATLMVAGGARGGQTRSGGLGQGSKKPAKGSAVALRDAWRHRMAKHGFATPWQLRAARALRNEWWRLAVTTPDERDDPLCASVCAAVQVLADRNKLFGSRPAEVNVDDSSLATPIGVTKFQLHLGSTNVRLLYHLFVLDYSNSLIP